MVKALGPDEPEMRQKALALEIFRGNKPWVYVSLYISQQQFVTFFAPLTPLQVQPSFRGQLLGKAHKPTPP
jgi:hypothetical protein